MSYTSLPSPAPKCARIKVLRDELNKLIAECSIPTPTTRPPASLPTTRPLFREVAGPMREAKERPRESFLAPLAKNPLLANLRKSIYAPKALGGREGNPLSKGGPPCEMYKQIISTPCDISRNREAYQKEYSEISSTHTVTFPFPGKPQRLSYSILDSVVTHIVQQSKSACIGGRIELWLQGDPEDEDRQSVIPEATVFDVVKNIDHYCAGKNLIYFPLTAHWVLAKGSSKEQVGAGEKISSHAMAVLVDQERKIISYHEPNGADSAPWYGEISAFLDTLFKNHPYFKNYAIEEAGACLGGLQLNSELPMCRYFASFFVALKVSCPSLSNQEIVSSLLAVGKRNVELLLRQWACFVVNYAQKNGIFPAAEQLAKVWAKILNKFLNKRKYRDSQELWHKLREAEQVAEFDVVTALYMLNLLDKRLV